MTLVSVIIPTFNRARKVTRAISSVLYQNFTDYEIIVVDDGSSDGTREALAPFGQHIGLLSHTENLGVSAARNTGIEASRSPLIALLDSDDYWLPEKLSAQVNFFNTHPEAMACQTEEIWLRKGRRVNPRKRHRKPSGDLFEPSLKLCLVSPSSVMVRRSLLDEVGLFDEGLPACEDYDLWLRISCQHPIYLIDRQLVIKEGGGEDQLSTGLMGLDRFRIRALIKLLKSGYLSDEQFQKAFKELSTKCGIYGRGCLKRGKKEEGTYYLDLPKNLKKERSEHI